MCVGAQATFANRNSPNRRDLWCDFAAGQNAAATRLCALAKFDFDGFDVVLFTSLNESFFVERAIARAGSVVAGSQLPHEVRTVVVMR